MENWNLLLECGGFWTVSLYPHACYLNTAEEARPALLHSVRQNEAKWNYASWLIFLSKKILNSFTELPFVHIHANGRIMKYDKKSNLFWVFQAFRWVNVFPAAAIELSAHSDIQRLTAFQGLLSASTSAEFVQTLHPRHNIFWGFLWTTTQLLLQGIWGWIFAENGLRPGKKHQHHAALGPHGLFLYSLLHYPRQGYPVTIMNPFRGKARLSRAPSQAPIPSNFPSNLCPYSFRLSPFFQPFSVYFCSEETSNELHPGSRGNATS